MNSDANVDVVIIGFGPGKPKKPVIYSEPKRQFYEEELPDDFRLMLRWLATDNPEATVAVAPLETSVPPGYEVLITRLTSKSSSTRINLDRALVWCDSVEFTHCELKPFGTGLRVRLLARRII